MKTALLAATAIIALTAGSAMAATPSVTFKSASIRPMHVPPATLYSQNSPNGQGIDSQNFTSGSFSPTYNSAAADDFVVPGGHKWTVKAVDASGVYFGGYGPASSEVVTFYKSKKGKPGAIAAKGTASYTVNCTDTGGNFSNCNIPGPKGKGLKLSGGTGGKSYWVSVVANCSFLGGCGEWGFDQSVSDHNNPGQWENPQNGFGTGCTTWTNTSTCIGTTTNDYAFDLQGSST
jgi:hypothetical protein